MISTVTTSTVSTVTTTAGLVASLGLIAVLILISLLVVKELSGATDHPGFLRLSKVLNVSIIPMLIVFTAIVAANVAEAL